MYMVLNIFENEFKVHHINNRNFESKSSVLWWDLSLIHVSQPGGLDLARFLKNEWKFNPTIEFL